MSQSELTLTRDKNRITDFYPILQRGFQIKTQTGCSLHALFCDHIGLHPDYIENRIKTVMLNGKPVDDLNSAVIKDGSVIALSAAMPGLVGAVMRRGGCLASFRKSITWQHSADIRSLPDTGMVTLKLFNLLLSELGPLFLEQGIWVHREDAADITGESETEYSETVLLSVSFK